MIDRSTDIRSALRKRQGGFLLNPHRFGGGGGGGGDPHWADVQFLLKMDGTDGATTFTDSGPIGYTWTRNESPVLTTAQQRFGSASADFRRTGWYSLADAALAPGLDDFTFECWLRWNSASSGSQWGAFQLFTPTAAPAPTNTNIAVFGNTGYGVYVFGSFVAVSGADVPLSTWVHTAWARHTDGGVRTLRFFTDGVERYSVLNDTNITNTGMNIGAYYSSGFKGDVWMDEVRYTKGVARYTSAFTAPTEEFPTS
jgi:hypothetical protein